MAGKLVLAGRKGLYWFQDGNDTTNYSNGTKLINADDGSINVLGETTTNLTATGNTTLGDSATDTNTLNGVTSVAHKFVLSGFESIAAGGTTTALDLTKSVHLIDSDAGGDTFTLADGVAGQIMTIVQKTATGTSTITPTTKTGYTSVTLATAGKSVVLQFFTTYGWIVIGGNGPTLV